MKHISIIENAIKANHERVFYAQYPEHPKAYGDDGMQKGADFFKSCLNKNYSELLQTNETGWGGEEVSPYTQESLGIKYPLFSVDSLISNAVAAQKTWAQKSVTERADILIDALENIKTRFFDIAFATMHTTGQSYMMSFQASGPHANDRALESIAQGVKSFAEYPNNVTWEKPMGKFSITLQKNFKAIPKGVGLVIGCSTFPVWNTLPGLFADLITGNSVIVKPHPKAVLAIAIAVAEIQKAFKTAGVAIKTVQLACDTSDNLITKQLAEHESVNLIDYTGGSAFGDYVESIKNKTVFTEKAGVNSVIVDSAKNLDDVFSNLAFSVSLYSGQMCTAPQNFFIPEKIKNGDTEITFEEAVEKFKTALHGLVTNPKMGAGTFGAIQNEVTLNRVLNISKVGGKVELASIRVANDEFANARTCSPSIIVCNADDKNVYEQELFGPIVIFIKTKSTEQSVELAKAMCKNHGAITCAAYTTDSAIEAMIETEMNSVFAPVSFNLTGFIWVNQHASFSDFHVTGGNPAGNASFTNADFINRRFVWVGNRKMN
jgi:phenylacetic acid degradation protein paaN